MNFIIPFFLVVLSALFSGLTLSLFSLDKTDLETEIKLDNPYAKKVYEVRKDGNFLLCTLLLGNVIVNAVLAVFLSSLTSGLIASFSATTLIFLFGEVLPQSVCYKHALKIGAKTTSFVKIFMFLFYPVVKPISLILNKITGEEAPTIYSKRKFQKIIEFHKNEKGSAIDEDEERIVKGALTFSDKRVKEIMTLRSDMFALPTGTELSEDVIEKIKNLGFSRIPVYTSEINNITGIAFVKDMIGYDLENKKIDDFCKKRIYTINEDCQLDKVLNQFLITRNHLFIVDNDQRKVVGLITIEDVIEEILKKEIIDETDKD